MLHKWCNIKVRIQSATCLFYWVVQAAFLRQIVMTCRQFLFLSSTLLCSLLLIWPFWCARFCARMHTTRSALRNTMCDLGPLGVRISQFIILQGDFSLRTCVCGSFNDWGCSVRSGVVVTSGAACTNGTDTSNWMNGIKWFASCAANIGLWNIVRVGPFRQVCKIQTFIFYIRKKIYSAPSEGIALTAFAEGLYPGSECYLRWRSLLLSLSFFWFIGCFFIRLIAASEQAEGYISLSYRIRQPSSAWWNKIKFKKIINVIRSNEDRVTKYEQFIRDRQIVSKSTNINYMGWYFSDKNK